ncbi:serine hydrolase, partial [Paraburkholderia sp.]|uniref:serine hydrolase n=1 Tax=Paraburkholderia sp. TaxID=1926495 RepID=UPI003C79A561
TYPEMAAAGLWTTPTDLSKWIIEMQQSLVGKANHILTASMTHTMLTPIQSDYGLGVGMQDTDGKPSFSHNGSNVGYRAYYIGYEDGDVAVIMTNSDNGSPLAMDLVRSIAHVYGWPNFKQTERTAVTLPPASLTPYVGKFTATDMPNFEVLSRGDQLLFAIQGDIQPLLASAPAHFFTTETTMELRFDSPDSGAVIFGKLQLPFARTK